MDRPDGGDDLLNLADLSLAAYLRYLAHYGGAIREEDGPFTSYARYLVPVRPGRASTGAR